MRLSLDIWQARTRDNVQTGQSVTALPCLFVGTIYYGLWVQYVWFVGTTHRSLWVQYVMVCGYNMFGLYPQKIGGFTMDINESANPTNIPKNHTLKFRYDDEIEEKLRYLSEKHFVSKSEIVRKGIEIQYNAENE